MDICVWIYVSNIPNCSVWGTENTKMVVEKSLHLGIVTVLIRGICTQGHFVWR